MSVTSSGASATASLATPRTRAKADRRDALLAAAAAQFADRGFARVSLEDLGAAAGVSGPAVYRHFPGKQAVLAALLVGVSRDVLAGGESVLARGLDPLATLGELVAFQVDFAVSNADVIVVQDRDLTSLTGDDRDLVRRLQRAYIEEWVGVLATVRPDIPAAELRIRVRATIALINSTPHSARAAAKTTVRTLLESMALAALLSE